MNSRQLRLPPSLFLIIGVIAVSFSAIFIKWSNAPASVLGMYRLAMTSVLMIPLLRGHFREFRQLSRRQICLLALAGVFLGLHFLFWIGSLKYTTVASSTILITLQPIFVMIGSAFIFRERTNLLGTISALFAMLGTVLIGMADKGSSHAAFYGDILSVIGTAAVSLYMLVGQGLRRTISSSVYSFVVFSVASVVLFIYNVGHGVNMTSYPLREWGIFVLLAVVPTVFGHLLFNWLLQYISATTISMSILGEPVGAILLAALLLHEPITPSQLIGGAVCIIGVGLFIRFSSTRVVSRKQDTISA